jgi:transglutaminase-like putative cysteine protease
MSTSAESLSEQRQLSPSVLAPTATVESEHPVVREFAVSRTTGVTSDRERALRLYYAVRDEIRYDPYGASVTVEALRASTTLAEARGWCVSKAVLLAAACRSVGIPARLGFADVRNHLSTARMREQMQTEIFYWHGYTSIWLEDRRGEARWVKATPAFNIELCEKFGFLPLEFDGESDSLYHPFDREGRRHMEYLNERGEFDDLPLEEILATFSQHYAFLNSDPDGRGGFGPDADFERDVEEETAGDEL